MTNFTEKTITRRSVLAGSGAVAALTAVGMPTIAAATRTKAFKSYDNSPLQRHLCKEGHPKLAMDLQMHLISARVKGDSDAEVAAIRGTVCPHCDTQIATSLEYMATPYNLG